MYSTFFHRLIVRLFQLSLLGGLLVILASVPRAGFSAPTATLYYVAPTGSDLNDCLTDSTPCEHIQTAIDRSGSDDTINIAAGTYFETLRILDKNLTLTGQGAASTIIDGLQQGRVLGIFADTARVVTVSGLTLQNGQSAYPGGGISTVTKVSLVVLDTNIINNSAEYGGGLFNQGQLILNNVLLSGNKATSAATSEGGGLWNTGVSELSGVSIVNNTASRGGGISNLNVMTVTGSFIDHNDAVGNFGGGIYNRGSSSNLTLLNSIVSSNQAIGTNGGGVYNENIFVSSGTIISGNLAISQGGGIFNSTSGKITLSSSTLRNNTAQADEGGGLFNAGVTTVDNASVNDNLAGAGGGIFNAEGAQLSIGSSNVGPNTATQTGGGIDNFGTLTLLESALVYNAASVASGGGLHNAGTADLTNVTISDNTGVSGGGIQNEGGTVQIKFSTLSNNAGVPALNNASGSVTIANSILAQSAGAACGGTIASGTHNIDSGTSCGFSPANLDLSNTNAQLGPLQENGGNSLTRALAFSSPAVDTAANCPPPDLDQRGITRPQGNKCDRGTYEVIGYSGSGGDIEPNQCLNSPITLNDNLVIGRAQVGVNLTYNNRHDLTVSIIAPNNRKVVLLGPAGSVGQDLDTLFDDSAATGVPAGNQDPAEPYYDNTYQPSTPLAQLRGTLLKGLWTLQVCNSSTTTSGTLNRWALVVPEVSKPKVYLPLIRHTKK
jgi:subtilisin-like proprotein convertase family protein